MEERDNKEENGKERKGYEWRKWSQGIIEERERGRK